MTDLLARARRELRVISKRKEAKAGAQKRFGYMGGQGARNLGDDAMFDATREIFSTDRIVPLLHPTQERRLARMGLSGSPFFHSAILGGGTLINPYPFWIEQTRTAMEQGIPVWALGTGVGSFGFDMGRQVDLAEWSPLLARFHRIGVRGPRSLESLRRAGIENAEVTGDLALSMTRDQFSLSAATIPPRVAVNISVRKPEDYGHGEYERLPELESVLRKLTQKGWEVVFVAMHEYDVAAIRLLQKGAGLVDAPIAMPQNAEEFFNLVSPCRFTLAVRLHAAILSCCVGVPPLMLGYRDKCHDFMDSMNLAPWSVELHTARHGEVETRALELAEEAPGLQDAVLHTAQQWRDRLLAFATDAAVSISSGR